MWFGLLAVGLVAGCSTDPGARDPEIARLLEEESRRIRAATTPRPSWPGDDAPPQDEKDRVRDPEPTTVNKPAPELRYLPADEARDVAQRLQTYSEDAISGQGALPMTLADALRTAQRSGREYASAEEDYTLSAISLLIEQHQWSPRFFNDTTVSLGGGGDEGRFEHTLGVINTLRVTQRLPYGGAAEAAWVWDATDQLRRQTTSRYTQASELVLSASLPLLRGAGYVARETLIAAQRGLIYQARNFERFRREHLVSIATDYFQLLQAASQIRNQERQLVSLRTFEASTSARVEAGRLSEFERNIASNQVLSAIASLASQRESYILQLDRFKLRLGLPLTVKPELAEDVLELPEPEIELERATQLALEYRLDLQNLRDQLDDARRGVLNARDALLPDLNLAGNIGIPTPPEAREGGVALSPEDLSYSTSLTLSLPLDRTDERLRLRSAQISLARQTRSYEQARDNVVLDVRAALRGVDLARFRLTLAQQQVVINQRRLEEQNLKINEVEPQTIVDSQNELLNAENARDQAVTDLRVAILGYLLASDQLRVAPDGTFEPLPGMEPAQPLPQGQAPAAP